MDALSDPTERQPSIAELDARLRAVEARCEALTGALAWHAATVATATTMARGERGMSAGDALASALASLGKAISAAAEQRAGETV